MSFNHYGYPAEGKTSDSSSDAELLRNMHLMLAGSVQQGQMREQQWRHPGLRELQSSQLPVRRETCEELIEKASISGRVEILSDERGILVWEPRVAMVNETVLTVFKANDNDQIINGSRYRWTDCIELGSGSQVDIDYDPLIPGGSVIKVMSPRVEDGLFDVMTMRCLQATAGPDKTRLWFVSITNGILRGRLLANRQALAPLQPPPVGLRRNTSSNYVNQQQPQLVRSSHGSGVSLSTLLSPSATSTDGGVPSLLDSRSHSRESIQTPTSISPTTVPEVRESLSVKAYSPSPIPSSAGSSDYSSNSQPEPQHQQQSQQQRMSLKQRLLDAGRSFSNKQPRSRSRHAAESPSPFGVSQPPPAIPRPPPVSGSGSSTGSSTPPPQMQKTKSVFAKLFPRSSRPDLGASSSRQELAMPAPSKLSFETPRAVTPDLVVRKSQSVGGGLRATSSTPNIAAGRGGIDDEERKQLDGLFLKMKKSFSKLGS
ncbi:hypothetical protein BDR26DRAFT_873437 [Obelidium mucronatum]|nr:hypothetical protein BDR26DRAFT_873437 [Obelidium mucronatum]